MKIDITSLFFNSTLSSETSPGTCGWGTSIGQAKKKQCRIETEKEGLIDIVSGMIYKAQSDISKLDVSGGRFNSKEILLFAVFNKVFINNKPLQNAQYTMLVTRENTNSHSGRLMLNYGYYIKYNGIENTEALHQMASILNCSNGCWFVYEIAIKNQDELHFFAKVVDENNSVNYECSSQERSAIWRELAYPQSIEFDKSQIISAIGSTNLIYSDDLIIRYAYSLMTKPFAILSGLAGSGKTQLAIALAHSLSEDIEEQVCLVPVGADWTNREPLLGYPNALKSNEYATPENGVLDFIIRADKNPQKPYFLILDEMNLSYVERYFADFLSVMESGKEIPLWENGNDEVPASIKLPKNLYITGTINVDETTYMFSPKVLDRANVIEFKVSEKEMEDFLSKNPDVNICNANGQAASIAQAFVEHGNNITPSTIADEKIKEFFRQLKAVNAEFGYRSATEMRKFINLVLQDKALDENTVIDAAIVQKMLPKLHGSRKKLDKVLGELWKLCFDKNAPELNEDATTEKAIYPLSADKILRMYKCAHDNGFTSFAEA